VQTKEEAIELVKQIAEFLGPFEFDEEKKEEVHRVK
jgi:hypothetical protein